MSIWFHSLHASNAVSSKSKIKKWLIEIVTDHKKELGTINIIFINDDEILKINQKYLNQNYFTDIITFNFNSEKKIEGDIYISMERVIENAKKFQCSFQLEILRVIVHGVFHLLGYDDKTKSQKALMRQLEENALRKFHVSGNR